MTAKRPRFQTRSLLILSVLALGVVLPSQAEQWPNWRGPSHNGSSPESGLPTTFSKTENVAWGVELKGQGASTPVVWDDQVFITSAIPEDSPTADGLLSMQCFDRESGNLLWEDQISGRTTLDNRSNTASPSPATDGTRVVFFFGTGDLLSYSMDGKRQWHEKLTADDYYFSFLWTFSSSPLLLDEKIYLPILQRDKSFSQNDLQRGEPGKEDNDSYLLCLDAVNGKELWRENRPSKAVAESLEAFSTVVPHEVDGKTQLLIAGGDCLTGHDASTGKELWRWGTWNPDRIGHWRLVPTPCAGAGKVVIPAPKKAPVYAISLGGSGDLGEDWLAWTSDPDEASSDVSSALFYQGRYYLVDGDRRTKALVCLDPETGKALWRGELETKSKMEAAATGADGKIYMVDHGGKVFVASADGNEFKLLHQVEMGEKGDEPARSPIVVSQGSLFLRIGAKLYRIGS